MADATDLPKAKDPFEKMVAISIAVMAVFLSYISMKGDNGKTDSIVATNKAADEYAFFQAKSLKRHMAENEADILKYLANTSEAAKRREELAADAVRYKEEGEKEKKKAEQYEKDAQVGSDMNDRADLGGLFLQIAIVIASVAILSRQKLLWYASMILGIIGTVKFFFLH